MVDVRAFHLMSVPAFRLNLNFSGKIVKFNLMKKLAILLIFSFLFCEILLNFSLGSCPFHSFEPFHFSKSKITFHSCVCVFIFFLLFDFYFIFFYLNNLGEKIKDFVLLYFPVISKEIFHPPQ